MSVPLRTAEPWRPSDPEYKRHQVLCFICGHGGEPSNDAYRPHLMTSDCWCRKKGVICRMSEWNIEGLEGGYVGHP